MQTLINLLASLSARLRGRLTLNQRLQLARDLMRSGAVSRESFDRAVEAIEGLPRGSLRRIPGTDQANNGGFS
jgi:hypothetical protein